MQTETFWIIISVIMVLGAMAIAATVLVMRNLQRDEGGYPNMGNWHVELWNICYGYQVDMRFANTCILGRATLYDHVVGRRPLETDPTISREHCMLYEQDGMLLAWNMSAVNPAAINGYRLNQPVQVMPGDRVELGNSVFLVTRVERI